MANVKFVKCIADSTYLTPEAKYASLAPHDAGTFYAVGSELYLGDVLLSATTAAEIAVVDSEGVITAVEVEAALNELYHAQNDKTLWVHDDSASQSEFAKVYKFYQGENDYVADRTDGKTNPILKGTINIAKDKVVEDGSVVDIFFDDTDNTLHEGSISGTDVTTLIKGSDPATAADEGKYIKLILQNVTNPLYIAAKDLVDIYTGGTNEETTVTVTENVISAAINKIAATKVIYQAAAEAVYTQVPSDGSVAYDASETYYVYDSVNEEYDEETVTDASDYASKIVSPGLYTITTPAVAEKTIKAKVEDVESKVDALDTYVGKFTPQAGVNTVVQYIDTKTGEGVGALNSEAGVASKTSNVVTIKGGIVETAGLIGNAVADTTGLTEVQGYFNPADGKFYENYDADTSAYSDEIAGAAGNYYADQATGGKNYVWTGKVFAEIRPDVVLEEVAVTGAAADVSIADADSNFEATTVEGALAEIAGTLTWNEV